MADDDAVVRDAQRLPWADRLSHAHWKVRNEAYAAITAEATPGADANASPLVDFGACVGARRRGGSGPACVRLTARARAQVRSRTRRAPTATPTRWTAAWRHWLPSWRARTRSMPRGACRCWRGCSARAPAAARPNSPARPARSCAGALAHNLVAKGLAARPKTATRASEALLLLVELDAAEATQARCAAARSRRPRARPHRAPTRPLHAHVCALLTRPACTPWGLQEALFKGLLGKVPKGVAACVDVLLQALKCDRPPRAAHAFYAAPAACAMRHVSHALLALFCSGCLGRV
jgi:hypothetical protein